MKQLISAVLKTSKIKPLIIFTVFSMILLTVASQLEIFGLGVITKKGPDVFELFAPVKDGVLVPADQITIGEIESRWSTITATGSDVISREDAKRFVSHYKGNGVIDTFTNIINQYVSINENLIHLAIFLICIALFKAATLFSYRFATKLIAINVSKELRLKYFEHIQRLPMSFYQKYNIGSLSSRVINDSYLIAESINSCLINYLQTPFTVITTLTLCFLTSWQLSLIMFLGFPLIIFPIFFIARRIKKISKQILSNQEHFLSVLIDFISGIQTVKVFSMEDFSLKKYVEKNDELAQLEKRSARYDVSSRPIVHTLGMSFLGTALLYGLYVQQMSVSEVVFFCGLLYVFYEPIKKFAEENNHIQRGIAASERMFEILDLEPHFQDADGAKELKEFKDCIEFRDVWFKYDEEWVLKGLNLTIEKGQTVAVVGPTGAGKSTIVQLLPRLYEVSKGDILIDGVSIKQVTQKSLRKLIAVVPQKSFLFIDTIATNVSYGQAFPQKRVEQAALKAYADKFIRRLPQGYQTVLSEAGKDLSGGQQQRLTIARALAKEAPILVMDEATSSLDMVSENHIKTAIHDLRGEVTQVIIAHRLSTIEDADKIVYVDEGVKIAEGTKDELMSTCKGFKLMWEMMHRTESKCNVREEEVTCQQTT
ncbi:MAG: ABC transporter ATP-binding protein [Chlamydiota bacterium]